MFDLIITSTNLKFTSQECWKNTFVYKGVATDGARVATPPPPPPPRQFPNQNEVQNSSVSIFLTT